MNIDMTRRTLLHLAGASSFAAAAAAAARAEAGDNGGGPTFASRTPMRIGMVTMRVRKLDAMADYYRDVLGFEIGWLQPGKGIGSVSRGEAAIFFRRRQGPFEPAVHWIFAEDIDATYAELQSSGAKIVEPLEKKPWGLRQFTVEDPDGNRFYFHCD